MVVFEISNASAALGGPRGPTHRARRRRPGLGAGTPARTPRAGFFRRPCRRHRQSLRNPSARLRRLFHHPLTAPPPPEARGLAWPSGILSRSALFLRLRRGVYAPPLPPRSVTFDLGLGRKTDYRPFEPYGFFFTHVVNHHVETVHLHRLLSTPGRVGTVEPTGERPSTMPRGQALTKKSPKDLEGNDPCRRVTRGHKKVQCQIQARKGRL
jgi:hypothetical protein